MQKNPGSVALLSHRATVFLQCPLPSSFSLSTSSPSVFTSADPLLVLFSGQEASYRLTTITRLTTGEHARGCCSDVFVHSLIHSFRKCLFSTCSTLYLALLSVLEIKRREGGGSATRGLGNSGENRGIKKTVAPLRLQGVRVPRCQVVGREGTRTLIQ